MEMIAIKAKIQIIEDIVFIKNLYLVASIFSFSTDAMKNFLIVHLTNLFKIIDATNIKTIVIMEFKLIPYSSKKFIFINIHVNNNITI